MRGCVYGVRVIGLNPLLCQECLQQLCGHSFHGSDAALLPQMQVNFVSLIKVHESRPALCDDRQYLVSLCTKGAEGVHREHLKVYTSPLAWLVIPMVLLLLGSRDGPFCLCRRAGL